MTVRENADIAIDKAVCELLGEDDSLLIGEITYSLEYGGFNSLSPMTYSEAVDHIRERIREIAPLYYDVETGAVETKEPEEDGTFLRYEADGIINVLFGQRYASFIK